MVIVVVRERLRHLPSSNLTVPFVEMFLGQVPSPFPLLPPPPSPDHPPLVEIKFLSQPDLCRNGLDHPPCKPLPDSTVFCGFFCFLFFKN